jgi:Periplasmic protein involved in polysaccharide export
VSGYGIVPGESLEKQAVYSTKAEVDSAKVDQRIFGFSLFNNDKLTFEPTVNIPVSQGYVLGAADELVVDVWGSSQQTYELTIDRNGAIQIPLLGPITVGGITLEEATALIRNRMGTIYGDLNSSAPRTFMSVRTGTLKPIRVNVIGEAFVPGTYTVPGTATLFNVLYLSGGPSKEGSFRDIQLIRAGKVVSHLDVYDFLINGKTAVNVPLRDDDIIMIPTYINRVHMYGFFKRKGIFEAREGESVGDMVNFAGGFDENANRNRIELYRKVSFEREFRDVNPNNMSSTAMANGDSLYVGKILERYRNMVTIKGAVFMPGNYEYNEGMTLSTLFSTSGGVIENAFLNRGFIERLKPDYTKEIVSFNGHDVINKTSDVPLKAGDVVFLNSINDMQEAQVVGITGMVQKEGQYPYRENMKLGDLILLSGGLKEAASGSSIEVMRKLGYEDADKATNRTSELFNFAVSRQLEISDAGANFVLSPFDQVSVRKMPGYRESGQVTVNGQVFYAGNYGLSSYTERVSQLVKRAGGLTPNAYLPGARLVRKLKLTDEMIEARKEMARKDSTLHLSNTDFEVISINLATILNKPGGKDDIFLEANDLLEIPGYLSTVKMSGQVLSPSSTVYVEGNSAKDYIYISGGFANDARKGRIYVIYPNGASASTKGGCSSDVIPK